MSYFFHIAVQNISICPTVNMLEQLVLPAVPGDSGTVMCSENALIWRKFFHNWPRGLSPCGVLVTREEQIPFEAFMVSDEMVLLERRTPDTQGARKVLVPFALITALKIVDVVNGDLFASAGFRGCLDRKRT